MMNRASVLLVDDHKIVAEGLRSLLDHDFELVGIVGDGIAMLDAAKRLQPDVIVTDISMPRLNGLDAVRQLKKEGVAAKVIFLTMHSETHLATEAFRVGASGYLLKHSAGDELISAIHEVVKGRVYLSPLIAADVLSALAKPADRTSSPGGSLTPRQRQVLQLVAEGRTMKEIASLLKISTRTAESHKYDMMRELGIQTTAELVQFAVKIGLVAP